MRTAVFPENNLASYEAYGYSAAISSGGFLFVSGQVGVNNDGTPVVDPEAQFDKLFENLGGVLDAGGCSYDDIVDVTSFHVDMHTHFETFAAAKQRIFKEPPFPNWTAVGVVSLADPALLLEVKVIAKQS